MVKGVGSKIKWKRKKWFNVISPSFLGERVVGQTPAIESAQVENRKVKANVSELINDPRKQDKILTLKVENVTGLTAKTSVREYSINKGQLRRIIRKGGSRIDLNQAYQTKDGKKVNIKTVLFTHGRCQVNKKKDIREKSNNQLEKIVNRITYEELIMSAISAKIQIELKRKINKIHPIRTVEIINFKIL